MIYTSAMTFHTRTFLVSLTLAAMLLAVPCRLAADLSQAYSLLERKDYARAEPLLRRELAARDDPEAHYLLGFLLVETFRYREAETHLRVAVTAMPGQGNWLMVLAKSLLEQGRNLAAAEVLERAIAISSRPAYHHAHAISVLNAGDLQRAEASWRTCLALQPDHPEALGYLGGLLYDQARTDEALPVLERAITANAGNIDARYRLGTAYRQAGRTGAAESQFMAVLEQVPGHVGALHNLGRMLLEQGRPDEGRTILEQFRVMSALRDDIDYYAFAVKKNPDNVAGRLRLADLYLEAGRSKEALAEYLAARQQAPREPRIYRGLATAYQRLGEMENARRAAGFASALEQSGNE